MLDLKYHSFTISGESGISYIKVENHQWQQIYIGGNNELPGKSELAIFLTDNESIKFMHKK